jgi:SAM-dependent methyltransferase
MCGASESRLFDQRRFKDQPVTNRICSRCGLVYQSPRMSDKELSEFYKREYRQLYQGGPGPNPRDLAVQRRRAAWLASFTAGRVEVISRCLDIGCSSGELLVRFQEAFQCQPVGVEPGDAYREYAQGRGLKVCASLDELKGDGEAPFDLVSMAHVLEHIPDPVSHLASLREQFLEPNGYLLVEVPNLYAHDSFEVAHAVSYSPHTLVQTLKKSGYRVVALQRHGRPRSQLIPLYLTALARPLSQPHDSEVVPERGVRFKRRLGMLRRRLLTRLFPGKAWQAIEDNT